MVPDNGSIPAAPGGAGAGGCTEQAQVSASSDGVESAEGSLGQIVLKPRAKGQTTATAAVAAVAAMAAGLHGGGAMGREHQSRILFVSLLENYCRTYDDDPLRNRRLFFAICRTLYTMGIIGKEYVDEMASIRATYSGAFRQLVLKAQQSLDMYEQHDIESGIRSLMSGVAEESESSDMDYSVDGSNSEGGSEGDSEGGSEGDSACFDRPKYAISRVPTASTVTGSSTVVTGRSGRNGAGDVSGSLRDGGESKWLRRGSLASAGLSSSSTSNTFETMMMDVQRSRYHDDFVQLRCLGKGGFGKVYEVRNKLDGRRYAVKHIRIRGQKITADKTLREIKTLANLDHPNIVRYYSSWIEVSRSRRRLPGVGPSDLSATSRRYDYACGAREEETEEMVCVEAEEVCCESAEASRETSLEEGSVSPYSSMSSSPSRTSFSQSQSAGLFSAERRIVPCAAEWINKVRIGPATDAWAELDESDIVFEASCCEAPSTSDDLVCEQDSAAISESEVCLRVEPISIGGSVGGEGRHRRQRSMLVAATDGGGSRFSPSGSQAQSLPSQDAAAAGYGLAMETTLLVQMQLCQTTLQEFIAQRNRRIAERSLTEEEPAWEEGRGAQLLIDPVMNVRMFRAIVEGVKYFHTRGVIHRDLKGANVFLDIAFADSGGEPISRSASGIGGRSMSLAAAAGDAMGDVHSDAWDAIDGGNLKERSSGGVLPPQSADAAVCGNSACGSWAVDSRKIDWDSVFASIMAVRSGAGGGLSGACTPSYSVHRSPAGSFCEGAAGRPACLWPEMRPPSLSASSSSSSRLPGTRQQQQPRQWAGTRVPLPPLPPPLPPPPPVVSFIPRIGDFGLATTARQQQSEYSSSSVSDVQSQQRRTSNVGTITYAAPEQLREQQTTDYNEKADIYSLGIVFFELYYPFSTAMERMVVIGDLRRGVFPAQFVQMWPKEAAFILRLMDADPRRRPSAKEILALDLIDVPSLESAQLKKEVVALKHQLRLAHQRNEELGLRVRELERIVDMSL